jgi:four helix bundle protein
MSVTRYEDLIAWQLATQLRKRVIEPTANAPVSADRRFCDQTRSAAASITANIAEGFGRYTRPDFVRFLRYARGSAYETREWLRDRGYFNECEFTEQWDLLERVCGALTRLIIALERKDRGDKPRRRALAEVP